MSEKMKDLILAMLQEIRVNVLSNIAALHSLSCVSQWL